MRNLILLCLFGIPLISGAQNTYVSKKGESHLIGKIDVEDLSKAPFNEWFEKKIDNDYHLENIHQLADWKVEIFLGTWCGDSRMWVPQFMKLWTDNKLPLENLSFVALHNEDDQYKRSPEGLENGLNIHRVPTFIFYDGEKEMGRIVESPINDLKTDVLQIAMGVPSAPRYRAVSILNEKMNNNPIDSLYSKNNYRDLLYKVYAEVTKPSELNNYGYVLKAKGELKKAEFVFFINRNLFKFDPNTWDSLGEIYLEQGKLEDAKTNYKRVLELDPLSENAVNQLKIIDDKLK